MFLFSHFCPTFPLTYLHRLAMFELAENLLRGQLVSPDPLRAVQFLEKSASLGHPVALWTLGQLLIKGCDGVQLDTKRGDEMVSAAIKAEPYYSKKVFVPYKNPTSDAVASTAIEPASSATPDPVASAKAEMNSLTGRLPLYGAAVVGVALLVSFLVSRMRRK